MGKLKCGCLADLGVIMSESDDVIKEFLTESNENLDQVDRELVELEKNPANQALIGSIFRSIHTIKGLAGFLAFPNLERLTHAGESLLSDLREGKLQLSVDRASALLAMVDAIRKIMSRIQESGAEGNEKYQGLIESLNFHRNADKTGTANTPVFLKEAVSLVKFKSSEASIETPHAPTSSHEKSYENTEDQLVHMSDSSIRVDVGLLDKLMNQVGELVLVRNQLLQFTSGSNDSTFLGTSQRLNLITSELQEGVMKTRMQPIDNVWNKFPRLLRDLAQSCGKVVRLEMKGNHTELDRTIIEAIKDPMTHLIRNAVDHGIETAEERAAAGKVIEGCISLRAYHEGGQVNIEMVDDGGGMDTEKIKKKALQRGLLTEEQIGRMNDREIQNLIFLPGFTTKERVTNVSGRGVGMDVVKTNIERIGGTVEVLSKMGEGTTIKMKIPLTLAIIPALMIDNGGGRYAIPQISLVELLRLEGNEVKHKVEYIHNAPVYRLRGKLLPLVYLRKVLKEAPTAGAIDDSGLNIVVLQTDNKQFGLVVERINDTEEIVVKPLGLQLKSVSVFAGATIMGDGMVALILDVMGLAQKARVISQVIEDHVRKQEALKEDLAEKDQNRVSLLLLAVGGEGRAAIRLSEVTRLEVFPKASLEKSGNLKVIQHRNEILPLIHLSGFLQKSNIENWADQLQVVVHMDGEKKVGLVVDKILDIVEGSLILQQLSVREGVMGTAVIQNRVTDLVDMKQVVRHMGNYENPNLLAKKEV
jgi:two-component system, chemotaxis family, sensor kinase CheA